MIIDKVQYTTVFSILYSIQNYKCSLSSLECLNSNISFSNEFLTCYMWRNWEISRSRGTDSEYESSCVKCNVQILKSSPNNSNLQSTFSNWCKFRRGGCEFIRKCVTICKPILTKNLKVWKTILQIILNTMRLFFPTVLWTVQYLCEKIFHWSEP